MKQNIPEIVLLIFGILLIVVHGIWPQFGIDYLTVLILLIVSIPIIASYLKRVKLPGAEFEFKDAIEEAQELVRVSVEKAKSQKVAPPSTKKGHETFRLDQVRDLLGKDHILALAALRIEIENKLRLAASRLQTQYKKQMTISRLVSALLTNGFVTIEQAFAIRKIAEICNMAIHGGTPTHDQAVRVISLAEDLNRSFPAGYSIDFYPNPDYEQNGLLCEWQHCIENMPLREKSTKESCRVFGHDCPGGISKVAICKKRIEDISKDGAADGT